MTTLARKPKRNSNNQTNLIEIQETQAYKRKHPKNIQLIPKNTKQEEFIQYLNDPSQRIIFSVGPAGTGKTILSVLRALKDLAEGNITKIILTRPAVGVSDENHGFLPGDINKKMEPWVIPIMDIIEEFYSPPEINKMIEEKIIEICPLMYMRGRTFKNTTIVLDEAQNTNPSQMKAILTRMGQNSRLFVTGDLNQTDVRGTNGLFDFFDRLKNKNSPHISQVEFQHKHIERDYIVEEVLSIYGEDN